MKRFFASKMRWWLAGAGLLLVASMALSVKLIPYSNAKYVSKTDEQDTGISGISNDDLDTLLRKMMNERYPVGSIYITADPTMTKAAMESHFGGEWALFAIRPVAAPTEGMTVVGQNMTPSTGGNAIGGGGTTNASTTISGAVSTNSHGLTIGGGSFSGGALSISGGMLQLSTTLTSMSTTVNLPLVIHGHGTTSVLSQSGSNLGQRSSVSPCCSSLEWVNNGATAASTGSANVTMSNAIPAFNGTPLPFTTTIPNISGTLSYTLPTVSVTNPAYPSLSLQSQHSVTNPSLAFSHSGLTFGITDRTLQPYVAVYMYRRVQEAALPSLPALP